MGTTRNLCHTRWRPLVLPPLTRDNSGRPPPTKTRPSLLFRLADCRATRHSRTRLVSWPLIPPISSRGAGCFTRISRGSPCCGSAFWPRVGSDTPLLNQSPPPSRHPNAKHHGPSSRAPPNDCPVCGRPHPTPFWGNGRKPGVLPWSERKSRRGKLKTVCTAGWACPIPQ